MLLDAGRVFRRHLRSEHRLQPLLIVPRRSFHRNSLLRKEDNLPYLEPLFYIPTNSNPAAKNIAVLGGGVTGLTAAFELARTIHDAKITVYEQSGRFGGWIDSEVVKVDDGEIIFEWGARSFRPALEGSGWTTATLLAHLEETDLHRRGDVSGRPLIGVPKSAAASQNRFLYYPDHLVRMPSPYGGFWKAITDLFHSVRTESIWDGVLKGIYNEIMVHIRSPTLRDESVGDFLTRRFGAAVADNFASAVLHGIYAGDIYKMSVRTILPALWHAEGRSPPKNRPGVIWDLLLRFPDRQVVKQYEDVKLKNLLLQKPQPLDLMPVVGHLKQSTLGTWGTGMGELIRLLLQSLEDTSKVELKPNTGVTSVSYDKSKVAITAGGEERSFDYVVTTLPPGAMKTATNLDVFDKIDKAVTVMVVNLYYRPPTSLPDDYEGFGYLIPRSVPMEQNPERALGVVFANHSSGPNGQRAIQYRARGDRLGTPPEELRASIDWLSNQIENLEASKLVEIEEFAQRGRQLRTRKLHLEEQLDDIEAGRVDLDEEIPLRVGQDTVPGMKLTVMLGGHWWDGWEEAEYPSEKEGIDMAKSLLRRHLNLTDEPTVAKARLQRDCIPQYPVGYRDLMADVQKGMSKFNGQLKFAGPFYQGAVGINDCIRGGMYAAMSIRDGWNDDTGLEKYLKDEIWVSNVFDQGFKRDVRYVDELKEKGQS